MFYLLKKGFPEFSPGDGAFQGHEYRHGKKYPAADVPPEYLDWFELVGEEAIITGFPQAEEPDEVEAGPSAGGEEDFIND